MADHHVALEWQHVCTYKLDLCPLFHKLYYKGTKLVVTRAGPKKQSSAYKFYREACGRDQRVKQLWGKSAPFTG